MGNSVTVVQANQPPIPVVTAIDQHDRTVLADTFGLDTLTTRRLEEFGDTYGRVQRSTVIRVGSVYIPAFTEPKWRDLGEGPSWQERYELPMPVQADLWWGGHRDELWCRFPVLSTLRQGGAKWGGVSVVSRDETTPVLSSHRWSTDLYCAAAALAGDAFQHPGARVSWARGVSLVQVPYDHEPTSARTVLSMFTRKHSHLGTERLSAWEQWARFDTHSNELHRNAWR